MTVGDYKDQDDFILVRRFMSTELGIQSKNEMLLYALIYSYSDGGSAFYGSVMTGMEKTEHRMKWLMSITIW